MAGDTGDKDQGQEDAFDPNAFEKGQEIEAKKAQLMTVVGKQATQDGEVDVTQLDAISHHWRQTAVQMLKVLDPAAYKKYREMKYAGGESPTLEQRKSAYKFAVKRFLEISYTKAGV